MGRVWSAPVFSFPWGTIVNILHGKMCDELPGLDLCENTVTAQRERLTACKQGRAQSSLIIAMKLC